MTGASVGCGTSSADTVEGKYIFHLIIQLMPCAWLRASLHCEKFFKIDGIAHFVDKAVRLAVVDVRSVTFQSDNSVPKSDQVEMLKKIRQIMVVSKRGLKSAAARKKVLDKISACTDAVLLLQNFSLHSNLKIRHQFQGHYEIHVKKIRRSARAASAAAERRQRKQTKDMLVRKDGGETGERQ